MKMIKCKQDDAYHQEQRKLEENHHSAGQQRPLALTFVPGGQQPLHNQLIGSVAGAGEKRATDQAGPEQVWLMPVEVEMEDGELASRNGGEMRHFRRSEERRVGRE